MFYNWDSLSLADGVLVLLPPLRHVQLMVNVCPRHHLPYAPSGLRSCHLLQEKERARHHFAPTDACLISCKSMTSLRISVTNLQLI